MFYVLKGINLPDLANRTLNIIVDLLIFIKQTLNMEIVVAFLTDENVDAKECAMAGTFIKFCLIYILLRLLIYL